MIGNRTKKINEKNNVLRWLGCNQGFFFIKRKFSDCQFNGSDLWIMDERNREVLFIKSDRNFKNQLKQ